MYLSLLPYVLSPALMRLWGYPLVPEDVWEDSVGPVLARKRKQSFDGVDGGRSPGLSEPTAAPVSSPVVVGLFKGSLPSESEAIERLGRIEWSRFTPEVFPVRHKPSASPSLSPSYGSFYRTLPASSAAYRSLSDSETSPLDIAVIDCEMCDTLSGPQLTRLSLLDSAGQTLLDTLVRPAEPILNYRTEFSGLTEKDLLPVTVTLQQVQLAVLRLVSSETILVGHSLENDLLALRLAHRNLADSAQLFPHPHGFPRRLKLKQLAADFLHQRIQTAKNGHDSASGVAVGAAEGEGQQFSCATVTRALAAARAAWSLRRASPPASLAS
mmetsp:Transcript_10405/g.15652  ORF Transcript_10405/g.15652 Transcript_10405/m.15652 type:complete len:326 (-) Transcript_10405:4132-5109(-)